jgi:hypothetical protein
MMPRHALALLVLGGAMIAAACADTPAPQASAPASPGAPAAAQSASTAQAGDPRFIAADLPLLPTGIVMAVRPVPVMRATYEFAARHPEVMKYVPCFCGCERGGHQDNHDCFVGTRTETRVTEWDTHAIGCEICVDVAYQAYQMHSSGASVVAIREAIEKQYASITAEGRHTPTPMPKRGGASHD